MARSRSALREVLEDLMEGLGLEPNLYYQPPSNIQMAYPCIVYKRDYQATFQADNEKYAHYKRWQLTIIDRNPDSPIPDKVEALEYTTFIRSFTADGLNHTIINIYF